MTTIECDLHGLSEVKSLCPRCQNGDVTKYIEDLEYRFSCLLDYATGSRLSKTNYTKEIMYKAVDRYVQDQIDDGIEDYKEDQNLEWVKQREKLQKQVDVLREAIQWAWEFFTHRDMMNGKVHCAPVRFSPITERIQHAVELCDKIERGES